MRRSVFGTTPESTSPTIVSLNDQKISATHSLADLNLCATIQKKSKVYCVLFFKLTCRIIYARLYSRRTSMTVAGQAAVTYGYDDTGRTISISQGSSAVAFT